MRIDFDSVWKETTEVYFPALLELFEFNGLPQLGDHEPVSFLDQEMQAVARVLGEDDGLEVTVNSGGTEGAAVGSGGGAHPEASGEAHGAAGSESRPYPESRGDRRRAKRSRRLRVDKLVRVPLRRAEGAEAHQAQAKARANRSGKSSETARPVYWLAHIEVQTQRDPALPRRLFDYHYHIERQHRCRVITFVILGDLSQSWRPDRFSSDIPPLGMGLEYVAIKLIDIEKKLEDPKFRGNPVAMVVRAHLAALRTRRDLEARYTQRVALCRRLYEEGFSQKDVVFIHGLIDRLMILPRPLMIRFRQELFTIEKNTTMPYVDTLTRMSRQEGRQEGLKEGSLEQARESVIEALEIRFGEVSAELRERISALDNLRTLKAQHRRAITVPSLDQF